MVFVGADTVWKLKKAVALSFLDFSTVAAREKFCRRELELNRASAPGLYRDVVPVTRGVLGGLTLGGGTPVDWVLRMARVPEPDLLDNIVRRGGFDSNLQDAVADAVADYHRKLAPVHGQRASARLRAVVQGNVEAANRAGIDPTRIVIWRRAIEARIEAIAGWLDLRQQQGFVRRGHGDLHLGNLCLWHGRPVPFDALEFDEDLATIDLGYDLAFLLMDVECKLGRPAANRVLNRYIARTGDAALLHGLPVFLSLRAMVRSHIAANRQNVAEAQNYLDRAQGFLAAAVPVVVAVGGLPGAGKSTLARALAPELGPSPGALIVRSDEIRKRLNGVAPEQKLPPSAYDTPANLQVFNEILLETTVAAHCGHAVVIDATLIDPAQQAALARIAVAAGISFVGLFLVAPIAVLEARIEARQHDASDATVEVLHRFAAEKPPLGWHRIAAERADCALAAAREAIAGRRSHQARDVLES